MNFFDVIVGSTKLFNALADLVDAVKTLSARIAPFFKRAPATAPPDYRNEYIQGVIDIQDVQGTKAVLEKRQRVAMVAAEQAIVRDGFWGNGEQLASYRVTGARKVGVKQEGPRTTVLLAIEPMPRAGETHDIMMKRAIKNTFVDSANYFDLIAERPTGFLSLKVLFPRKRPPRAAHVVEWPSEKLLQRVPVRHTAGRRPYVRWKVADPEPLRAYSLRWAW